MSWMGLRTSDWIARQKVYRFMAQKVALLGLVLLSSISLAQPSARIKGNGISLEFDSGLKTRFNSNLSFSSSEGVVVNKGRDEVWDKFSYVSHKELSGGEKLVVVGRYRGLEKTIVASANSFFPNALLTQVTYRNRSKKNIKIVRYFNNSYSVNGAGNTLWSLQPGSYERRPDWFVPIQPGFSQDNFQGMNETDYGGGTPVAAIWNATSGVAVGSAELKPRSLSLPVAYTAGGQASLGVSQSINLVLKPGQSFTTAQTFVARFQGDAFSALRRYSKYMQTQGLKMGRTDFSSVGPIWCAWGYGRDFTVDQVIASLPVAKQLGFEWVGIDDGWQVAIGDWQPDPKKFPRGEQDIKKLVNAIHQHGLKAQLWWAPLAAHPQSQRAKKGAVDLVKNSDGSNRDISWWDSWYLCPAQANVQDEARRLTHKFIADWGFDGLKIDGQHLNASPDCYNSAHAHRRASNSSSNHSAFFKAIYDVAVSIRPSALVETCPCGTAYSIYNLPFQNMTVASDPESSLQVRQKGKILRAITGDEMIYFGDHVEISSGGDDFASSVGIGALPGSNFTLPEVVSTPPSGDSTPTNLTPERKALWKKWMTIAADKKLWMGEYLGELYDMGFDRPESHAVAKDNKLFYAFYAEKHTGRVQLRGLKAGIEYRVVDYVNQVDYGRVVGPAADINVEFAKHLLLEASPIGVQ